MRYLQRNKYNPLRPTFGELPQEGNGVLGQSAMLQQRAQHALGLRSEKRRRRHFKRTGTHSQLIEHLQVGGWCRSASRRLWSASST